jgi:hypothetical protein
VLDNCDAAILGHVFVDNQMVVVYDYEKLIEVFMEQFRRNVPSDETEDELREGAVEWIEYNIVGAYMGPGTPLILYPGDRAIIDELSEVFGEG